MKASGITVGYHTRVHNDYTHGFADEPVTGRNATHIRQGKYSLLLIQELQLCSAEQRQVLEEAYGAGDAKQAVRVEQVKCTVAACSTRSLKPTRSSRYPRP